MAPKANHPYAQDLDKARANYVPLTPLSFIERSAHVYPERLAVVHGRQRYSWSETYARCRRLASALAQRGIGLKHGDIITTGTCITPLAIAPNDQVVAEFIGLGHVTVGFN